MNFFQNSVLNKHFKAQDTNAIKAAYAKFAARFHDPVVQENIRNSKEEQYQGEFLIDLFVNVLGYIKNPAPNFNITTEYKNVKDSKKADGAILLSPHLTRELAPSQNTNNAPLQKDPQVVAVIELKGTETTDLNRIEAQAFGYKNNQPDCVYVITSNFEKLRFYIDNAIENIEFNLFTLTEKEFELLWLCLAFVNIEKNLAKRIKDESVSQEDVITKNLYNDYSLFKRELHQNLVELNADHDPLTLFKKSQKLLDRFLFLFFAEDRQLLPPNSVRLILDDWRDLQDREVEIALYARFKKYFEYLNTGFKGKRYDVFAYNGGLFKTDELLDGLKIDDELLYRHTLKLSDYDFASEVDVNILGHIFENSLNELDEIKAQLEGEQVDKSKSKRKKDGVFYTPKYITKYIVDNTVGKLCTEKKAELELSEEEYTTDRKRTIKTKQPLFDKLNAYRNWLLQLTICDPACGSGAFLNQALDFLINEHRYIDELQAKLFGDALVLSDFEKNILENNLFGVDINEESVEIAKLSLWLRTAQPNRKLNDLNNNIKCGNSLIDDPVVAGDKAFNWHNEFPSVFANGGFDVVIGNPPYGVNLTESEKKFLSNVDELVPDYEIYIYFISLFNKILKIGSVLSYIFPNTFLSNLFGKKYREKLLNNVEVYQIIDLSNDNTFSDASVRTCIFSFRNIKIAYQTDLFKVSNKEFKHIATYGSEAIISESDNISSLFSQSKEEKGIVQKIKKHRALKDFHEVSQGYIPYRRSDLIKNYGEELGNRIVDERLWHSTIKSSDDWMKEILGQDVRSYYYSISERYVKYGKHVASYVDIKFFNQERILIREITANRLFCAYIEEKLLNNPSLINIIDKKEILNLKYTLVLLNSELIGWLHNKISPKANKGLFPKILINDVREIPLVEVSKERQQHFITKADLMLSLNKELYETSSKFQRTIQRKFNLEELPGKLQNWYLLSYAEFITELAKKKVKMSLSEENEWDVFFLQEAKQALALKSEISKTDQEIDQMVYELYGLTEEEIKIVEGHDK